MVCGGLVGTWARWCLNWRDPCLWVVYYLFEGKHKWTRPVLISYWALLAMVSVAGWSRQLGRARRHRRYLVPGSREREHRSSETLRNENHPGVATQMMDAADSRMPTLSVNARRKFFHALAVVMFVPGIAVDVSVQCRWVTDDVARVYTLVVQCRICCIHICRIYSVFRTVAIWRERSFVLERVFGFKGFWDGHPQSLLSPRRLCFSLMARRVSRVPHF